MNEASTSRHDMRGFAYPLAPYLRKEQWAMDRLLAQSAKLHKAIAQAQSRCEALTARWKAQSSEVQHNLTRRPDPGTHQRGLVYLADLRRRIHAETLSIQQLEEQRAQLQRDCIVQQRKLDGLEQHRDRALASHAEEASRIASAEADRDWIARVRFREPSEQGAG